MLSSQFIEHFHFLRPWWGLMLLPTLALLLVQRQQEAHDDSWNDIIAPHLLAALRLKQFGSRWFNPVTMGVLLMSVLTLVLMGPSWRQQPSPLARDEAALVILLDSSASMKQSDVQPSRLERGKQKLRDLLERRAGSRSALIVYAGSAHTVLGLTDDADILARYLAAVDPRMMPRPGKFAEYALPLVDRVLGDSLAPTTILLVSDGVSDATASAFADWFAQRPHQLLVWGIGATEKATGGIPLEADALARLAGDAGGHYRSLTTGPEDVHAVARHIDAHYVVTEDADIPWEDGGYWLVFPALLVFSLWFRRGWTLHWCWAPFLAMTLMQPTEVRADNWFADLWLTGDQQGRLLMERGDYREAAERFNDPLWKGAAWYYAGEFKLAAEYFSRVDSPRARFNRAAALAQAQDYLPAVRIFESLLAENPDNAAAENNRAILQALIDEINRMSESQADEGSENSSREADEEQPRRADGADRRVLDRQRVQYSADQVLQDEKINEMWMRSIQRDPSRFLAVKFAMQLDAERDP